MKTPAEIIHSRNTHKLRQKHSHSRHLRTLAIFTALFISLGLAFGGITLTAGYVQLTTDLPSVQTLPYLLDAPDGLLLQPTRYYDRDQAQVLWTLENPQAGPRKALTLDEQAGDHLPKTLVDAVIAAIDPSFWKHPGFLTGSLTSPQPDTIALRLVTTMLTQAEPPETARILREKLLAAQLTHTYGREKILEWYLNSANYGKLAYGAAPAAWLYFNKPVSQLTLAETALLAATLDAPALNPMDTPEVALERSGEILARMVEQGLITQEEANSAVEKPPVIQQSIPLVANEWTAFLRLVNNQLQDHYSQEVLERGGYQIITTLDTSLQTQAVCTLAEQLSRLQNPVPESDQANVAGCESARLLPLLPSDQAEERSSLTGGVILINPQSGQILALAGSNAVGQPVTTLVPAPPGSLLTPYIYLNAFTRGSGSASLVWDIPANIPSNISINPNSDGQFHGPMRMRTALANDYLVPALQLLTQIGPETVWRTAQQLGLPSLQPANALEAQQIILRGGEITLLEVTHAFGTFGMQGVLIGYPTSAAENPQIIPPLQPTALLAVTDASGQNLFEVGPPQARPAISAQLAYVLAHILSDEGIRRQSLGHPNSLEIGRPTVVKQGRTTDGGNSWTVGMTPQIVTGVWIGSLDEEEPPLPNMAAAGVWNALMKYALREMPVTYWTAPTGITTLDVCDPSGQISTPDCPSVVREIFTPGSEPNQYDTLFQRFQINRETGQLATVFTAATLIETRVYMVVPPEALSWAQLAGLPTPPETYDLVSMPTGIDPAANIQSPSMFNYVRGEIPIRGTAGGERFSSYRIQIGQGLNPQQWFLVGEEQGTPVQNGLLANWDTSSLNGLYAIRLQVVDDERRVSTAILQVTVDNQPPDVSFIYPTNNQRIVYKPGERLTIQVSAQDQLGLEKIEIFVNQNLFTTLQNPPFAFSLPLSTQSYTLQATAWDRARNSSQSTITFEAIPEEPGP